MRSTDSYWLHKLIKDEEQGASWGDNDDIMSGNSGAGLFLLYASSQTDHAEYLIGATHVGDGLIAHSISEHGGIWTHVFTYGCG